MEGFAPVGFNVMVHRAFHLARQVTLIAVITRIILDNEYYCSAKVAREGSTSLKVFVDPLPAAVQKHRSTVAATAAATAAVDGSARLIGLISGDAV